MIQAPEKALTMQADHKTNYGTIDIAVSSIALRAGKAAMECYGVVGLAARPSIADLFMKESEILTEKDYAKAVFARKGSKGYEVSLYLYAAYGVKLTEVLSEVQKRVKYELEKTFQIKFSSVNVYVVDVKE